MGVRSDILESLYARPLSADEPRMFDWGEQGQAFVVVWRDPIDRKGRIVCLLMTLLRWLGLPSTAWYHHQAVCSNEATAEAFAAHIEQEHGGRCSIYPMPVNECLPVEPIRPKWLYSPTARGRQALDDTILTVRKRDIRDLIEILKGDV